jgi:hypothetical protein
MMDCFAHPLSCAVLVEKSAGDVGFISLALAIFGYTRALDTNTNVRESADIYTFISLALTQFSLVGALYVTMSVKGKRGKRCMISMAVLDGLEHTPVDTALVANKIAIRVLKRSECNMPVSLRAHNQYHAMCT